MYLRYALLCTKDRLLEVPLCLIALEGENHTNSTTSFLAYPVNWVGLYAIIFLWKDHCRSLHTSSGHLSTRMV